jgi:solute carrier family 35 protein E1
MGRTLLRNMLVASLAGASLAHSVPPSGATSPSLLCERSRRLDRLRQHHPVPLPPLPGTFSRLRGGAAAGGAGAPAGSLETPSIDSVPARDMGGKAPIAAELDVEEPPPPPKKPPPPLLSKTAIISVNLVLWWSLNVLFALANKECLNSWNHPWALACLHLAIGSTCMLPLYAKLPRRCVDTKKLKWRSVRPRPTLRSFAELREFAPVVGLLALGHVTSTLAPAYGTVAFSNIVKTAEPIFTCIFAVLLYRRRFPLEVYLSLLMVVCGVALVSAREVNFSSFSLAAGMVSNAAFALYAICAKRLLKTRDPVSTYALLTMLSCCTLAPVAGVMEWTKAGASKLAAAKLAPRFTGWSLVVLLVGTGLLQYLSNEIAFKTLSMIHPITYALSNTLKRSIVVGASLVFFGQSLPPVGTAGAALALLGALGYSLAIDRNNRKAATLQAAAPPADLAADFELQVAAPASMDEI